MANITSYKETESLASNDLFIISDTSEANSTKSVKLSTLSTYIGSGGGGGGTITSVTGTSPISSSEGTTPNISISAATTSAAGSMSAADKTKLDGFSNSGDYVKNNTDTYTPSAKITQIVTLTQAQYDGIGTPSDSTLYIIL